MSSDDEETGRVGAAAAVLSPFGAPVSVSVCVFVFALLFAGNAIIIRYNY